MKISAGLNNMKLKWTDKEKEILRDLYPEFGAITLSEILHRSPPSINNMASKLKIAIDKTKWKNPWKS